LNDVLLLNQQHFLLYERRTIVFDLLHSFITFEPLSQDKHAIWQ